MCTTTAMTVKPVEEVLETIRVAFEKNKEVIKNIPEERRVDGILEATENIIRQLNFELEHIVDGVDDKADNVGLTKPACLNSYAGYSSSKFCFQTSATKVLEKSEIHSNVANAIIGAVVDAMCGDVNFLTPIVNFKNDELKSMIAKQERKEAKYAITNTDIDGLVERVKSGEIKDRESFMKAVSDLSVNKQLSGLEEAKYINTEELAKINDELFSGSADCEKIEAACHNLFNNPQRNDQNVILPGGVNINMAQIQQDMASRQIPCEPGQQQAMIYPTPYGYIYGILMPDGTIMPVQGVPQGNAGFPSYQVPQPMPAQIQPNVINYSVPRAAEDATPIVAPEVEPVINFQPEVVDTTCVDSKAPEIPVVAKENTKPTTLTPEVVEAPKPDVVAELPHQSNPAKFDNAAMISKYPYLAEIEKIAISKGHQIAFFGIGGLNHDSIGLIDAHVYDQAGTTFNPFKSFTIDVGRIIDRRQKVFPYLNDKCGYEDYQAYPVFIYGKKSHKINSDLFDKLFTGGFDLLEKRDGMYSEDLRNLNKHVVMISMPTRGIDTSVTSKVRDVLIKAMKKGIFDEIDKTAGGPCRFLFANANKSQSTMSKDGSEFTLMSDGINLYYNGRVYSSARVTVHYVNGKFETDFYRSTNK